MQRMTLMLVTALVLAVVGCGGSSVPGTGDPTRKITWEQFQKMPPEEQGDPYVLNNLDDDARKKLNDKTRKRGR